MAYLNHNLPTFTCFLRKEFLYDHESGFDEFVLCDVHSVASIEKRVPLFECFLENGVNWTRRPIHSLCWKTTAPKLPLETHMYWDCFSPYIDVQVRNRLANLKAELIDFKGKTMDWSWENKAHLNTNFSETPEHKCAHFFKMDDGNFFAYPNNRIIWYDDAWIKDRISSNPGYKIDMQEYSVENKRRMTTSEHYIYEINKDTSNEQ